MTDEARLAAAFHTLLHHPRGGADADLAKTACEQGRMEHCRHKARALIAADPALAADIALGAAVRKDWEVWGLACVVRRENGDIGRIDPTTVRIAFAATTAALEGEPMK